MTDRAPPRHMHLGVFVQTPGHHVAGWRHPDATADGWPNLALMKHIAATAEAAKFDMFFLGDGFATGYGEGRRPPRATDARLRNCRSRNSGVLAARVPTAAASSTSNMRCSSRSSRPTSLPTARTSRASWRARPQLRRSDHRDR
jgi:alkanesulfonate monooxygenase SsuD/methylene tetrahydromethanopterin reductase-like flavin-dependent oxidoreductase (luciferase family)